VERRDVHVVRTRPPIPRRAPACLARAARRTEGFHFEQRALWEWSAPPPPRRSWRPALRVALALVVTLGLVAADAPAGLEMLVHEPAPYSCPRPMSLSGPLACGGRLGRRGPFPASFASGENVAAKKLQPSSSA
jgi:hypothetical protein